RGPRAVPAGDDARRPPRRDRGPWPPDRRRPRARGAGGRPCLRRRGRRSGPFRGRRGARGRGRGRIGCLPSVGPGRRAMTYFVTGATGFIGRHLVQELLRNREGEVVALVREGSRERLAELIEGWDGGERVTAVVGDLTKPRLGVDEAWIDEHRGKID